ncbi:MULTISPECIES: excinuclease ABC subunit UvrB [Methanosphaera]|jgi:excinuclease ABC subunit B|uniref:UvrABC system protein B n=2 Tax=Methanosphaera stadtmanae TaxID=2317 RepID=UVRB_METST|nr:MULTISPECIES: excinuclease ABC subunit UvrB [Methanosphaera]Q2NGT1.1 RecName: Full=UvrABC system protein B; Short=Protein UvrB; AltName: Full=Excinuclease ABC subunit B [Methanosphaera stadtmanae DSM 3091]ABC56972.1 UvrB [Methanosphaera stadtmanae DSM 3091]OEC92097.1 excinuclease ABC subunit B [Methanosphaera sp. A6]RAP47985.1 MAG: excinuclease ABC subunit B [Methanosphaera sp. DEW79]
MSKFNLYSDYKPLGDQPKAIKSLVEHYKDGIKEQTLEGVTGSGKTFTMANVIEQLDKPTLVMSHNKTLAAQLYEEFKEFFPDNAVEYFVSYYDYYQPEAYVAQTDTFIDKESAINEEIDRLRHSATQSLLTRDDVIVVSSVSCIYGIGSPEDYAQFTLTLQTQQEISREDILKELVKMQYSRNDIEFIRGQFRVRGDVIEIFPINANYALRIELWGDEIDVIYKIDALKGDIIEELQKVIIFPAKHFVIAKEKQETAIANIKKELKERVDTFKATGKYVEAQRIEQRTNFDMEMLQEIGYCSGIENYSMHMNGRKWGETPYSLLRYFPDDYLTIIDESHVTVPQIRGMYEGDRARKENLIQYGFRLPSAKENRPLRFDEFMRAQNQVLYVSATPAAFELGRSKNKVEQIIRPTGLVDPEPIVRPIKNQVDDLLGEIRKCVDNNQRVLVTSLTKKMAEDLTDYYIKMNVKARYLHSEISTLERTEIIDELRRGDFDCLVGVNLLREGLDLPEVALVAILDADKEGFLRSQTSLIQTIGRAARNVNGRVILYADNITDSVRNAVNITKHRRKIQIAYNNDHNITPRSVVRKLKDKKIEEKVDDIQEIDNITTDEIDEIIKELEKEMKQAAKDLNFEKAAKLRDRIMELKEE